MSTAESKTAIGIDIGGTWIKAGVLDVESDLVRDVERVPFPPFLCWLPEGHREVAPAEVLAIVRAQIERLRAAEPRCDRILLCGQMGGVMLCDARGRPLTNFLSWQDERTVASVWPRLRADLDAGEYADLGNELRPGLGLTTLYWLEGERKLPSETAFPCTIADWIAAALCGSRPVLHPTLAASLGAWSLTRGEWAYAVIERERLAGLTWPAVGGSSVGETDAGGARLPVHVAVGDQQCALLGAGLSASELSVNIGTGGQVACRSRLAFGRFQLRPWFGPGEYLRTVTHLPAGRFIARVVGMLGETARAHGASDADVWRYLLEAADKAQQATTWRVHGDEWMHAPSAPGAVLRDALDHVARAHCEAAVRIVGSIEQVPVVVSGGLARRSVTLRRAVRNFSNIPLRVLNDGDADESLLGLMRLAGGKV